MKSLTIALCLLLWSTYSNAAYKKIEGVDHENNKVVLDLSKSKANILIFLSCKCPCSDSHIDTIKSLSKKFINYKFIGVHSNYNESKEDALQYFTKKDLGFPVIHDKDSRLAKKFGALKTPHVYILNNNGEVIYAGGVTDRSNAKNSKKQYLEMALNDIKNSKTPRTPKTKTLGCYLKIKD